MRPRRKGKWYMHAEIRQQFTPEEQQEIAQCVRSSIGIAQGEADHHRGGWSDIKTLARYDEAMQSFLPAGGSRELFQNRASLGLSTVAIDLMGPGYITQELLADNAIEYGIGVCLGTVKDRLSDMNAPWYANFSRVAGNVLDESTWEKTEHTLERYGYKKAGVVYWIPEGAGTRGYMTGSLRVYDYLLQHAWDLVDEEWGMLFVQLPGFIQKTAAYQRWSHYMHEHFCTGNQSLFGEQKGRGVINLIRSAQVIQLPQITPFDDESYSTHLTQ